MLGRPEGGVRHEALSREQARQARRGRIKKNHILANSDAQAVKQAEDSPDCPVCDVIRDGQTVGQVV